MERMISAVFRDQSRAVEAYDWLRKHGYSLEEVNVLLSERYKNLFHDIEHDDKLELKIHDSEGAGKRGVMGATFGAMSLGLLAGGTILLLAEFGLLGVGALPATLAGLGAGAMFGGLAGGLIGYGFPETTAKVYEPDLQDGSIAIGVKPHNPLDERIIKSEFEKLHGEKILTA